MYLLAIGLVINTITSTYSAAFYPPDFFLKGPSSQATIYGQDGSKIVSEADAGSISSKGIVGPTFKASTVVGNAQSSQNCGACGSDSVNSNSSPGANKVLIQGPSMTSSITGPTNTADISGSGSSEQGYYASLPNGHDHNKVGNPGISADCDHKTTAISHEFQGSNLNNAYLPPIGSSKPATQHSGSDGAYHEHIQHSRGLSVDIQGPSAHSTITGPQNDIPKSSSSTSPSSYTSSITLSSHPSSSQSESSFPANHNTVTNAGAENKINPSQPNSNSKEYPEFSSIKATYIEPNQPYITPDYSHISSFPISDHVSFQSSHKSVNPSADSTISSQDTVGLTETNQNSEPIHVQPNDQRTDQGYSYSSSPVVSSHTPNNNGGSESLVHPSVTVQDLGNTGDNKQSYSSGTPNKDYYDSSSFAPPTYMRPDHNSQGNNAGNLQYDSPETGLSSFNNDVSGSDYDCYILKLPLNTYAYIVPSDDSTFLKKIAESVPVRPQIFYVHKSHHHHHQHSH